MLYGMQISQTMMPLTTFVTSAQSALGLNILWQRMTASQHAHSAFGCRRQRVSNLERLSEHLRTHL